MGPGQHPGHRRPGNLHPLGYFFLGHLQKIGQAHGLQFIYGNDYLLEGSEGNASGLKESDPWFNFYPPALFRSAHFVYLNLILYC
jgi:hypothetical protein